MLTTEHRNKQGLKRTPFYEIRRYNIQIFQRNCLSQVNYLMPYNRKRNVLSVSLNKTFPSFLSSQVKDKTNQSYRKK